MTANTNGRPAPLADSLHLREWRESRGWTQEQLAERIHSAVSTVSRMEQGKQNPSMDRLRELASIFGTSVASLFAPPPGYETDTHPTDAVPAAPSAAASITPESFPRDVPVYAMESHSFGDRDLYISAKSVGLVRRPPALDGVAGAFAIYVEGDRMAPEHNPGDLRFIHPHRAARPGDSALVELHPEDGQRPKVALGRVLRRDHSAITLCLHNPSQELYFPGEQVAKVYKILTDNDLFGV